MAEKELSIEVRLLLAFAISFVVVIASRYLLVKQTPQTPPRPPAVQEPAKPASLPSSTAASQEAPAPAGDLKQGSAEQEITVDSDYYRIVFSSRGGTVKSWALKGYRDEKNNPLDLVDPVAAQEFGAPLSIWTGDEALRQEVNGALFVPSATGSITAPATLTFEYSNGKVAARKEITFPAKSFVVDVKTDLWSGGNPVAHELTWRGAFGDVHDLGMRGNELTVFYRDLQKINLLTASSVKSGEATSSGSFYFAGIGDRFFTAAFLPAEGTQPTALRVIAFHHDLVVPGQQKPRPTIGLAVGNPDSQQNHLRMYVGPKSTEIMAAVQPLMSELIDYGWFAFVAKPLFYAMRWLHDHHIPNYGWVIILLTVFINFALFPLKIKSLRSTMKMQKLQPQIRALQDKYKQFKMNDPRKAEMNTEMMALYKQHGVNPLGGCLPMVIQLPFLYGFYKVLVVSIEMRHAPWILWVHDLSEPEQLPIKLLPLAMCGTQFILQRMSPSPSPDPAQQKVMMFMPIMFLFLFWNLSSGLVLYWLTGNLVGIAQQWYINQTEMKEMMEKKKSGKSGKKQAMVKR